MNRTTPLHFRSSVTLSEDVRGRLAADLEVHLANLLDARSMVKTAHWNLRGPFFFARHELFDRVAGNLAAHADMVAERIGTLGGMTQATVRRTAKRTTLAPYPDDVVTGQGHVQALVERLATLTTGLREGITLAGEHGDAATEDLLTEVLRALELDIWFLESHVVTG